MKNTMKYLLVLSLLFMSTVSKSQVTGVTFKIVYNSTTCLYDVQMTIASGSTGSVPDQEAYTASVNIVVPTGTTIGTSTLVANEPRTGSVTGGVLTRTTATGWSNTVTAINRTNLTGFDVYHFTPGLSNAYYPVMTTNNVITLFSISIATTSCGSGIRLWNNNRIHGTAVSGGDPTSANFAGDDFNNGMDIGSPTQLYDGNGTSNVAKPNPTVSATSPSICTPFPAHAVVTAIATPGSCAAATVTYAWTGPGAFTNSNATFTLTPIVPGTYNVTVTNSNGCIASTSTNVVACPLSVKLLSFGATADKCTVQLNWEVTDAADFQRFEVQYSNDGSQYATIGHIDVNKDKNNGKYSFSAQQQERKGYYRLKLVDVSGRDTYSQTATAVTACDNQMITISPNPTTGNIFIKGVVAGDEIKVIDMIGQVVATTISAGDAATIDLSRYAAGVYAVFVTHGESVMKVGQVVRQ